MATKRCGVAALLVTLASGQLLFNPESAPKRKPPPPELYFDGTNAPECPETDGVYADATYCDAYWTCSNGVAVESFCEDGLVFDPARAGHSDPCDTPHVVHCGSRQELQDPTFPSEFCPRKYGSFDHPDPTVCDVYYTCVNGVHTEVACAPGLHFNSSQGSCNWPAIALRSGCVEKPKVSQDGAFSCPPGPHVDQNGQTIPHPSFPNAEDCAKFYVCLNGATPQEASCDRGLVFDERTMLCALPDTVPECADWYVGDPEFAVLHDDSDGDGQPDFGDRNVFTRDRHGAGRWPLWT